MQLATGVVNLDTPVPIRTLKLSNIGPGQYLDRRPSKEFQALLGLLRYYDLTVKPVKLGGHLG